MSPPRFVPAPKIKSLADDQILKRARQFYEAMRRRRTIRDYSDRPVPRKVIEYCIRAAGAAPSGADLQPWHFVAVGDAAIKRQIRVAAEKEEKEFYVYRAPKAWFETLAQLGIDSNKPFLDTAPRVIAVFADLFDTLADGTRS